MARPLGLPVGSVRAVTLLALTARQVMDLRDGRGLAPWLLSSILICAASYFSARAARRGHVPSAGLVGARAGHEPLGLPAGTIRLLFLACVGYGAWVYLKHHSVRGAEAQTALVAGTFLIGVLVRWFLTMVRRPDDASTLVFEHAQGLASLVAAGGLVAMAVTGHGLDQGWTQPALAAACTYYAGVR